MELMEKRFWNYFPRKYQAVFGIWGMVIGTVNFFRLRGALQPPPLKAKEAPAPASHGKHRWGFEMPTMATFDAWAAKEQNWKHLDEFLNDSKRLGEWEKSLK